MPAIIICSTTGRCLKVLMASIEEYVPLTVPVYLAARENTWYARALNIVNDGQTFGESYNAAVHYAFEAGHESVVLCNDDVVLTPTTWEKMLYCVEVLQHRKPGYIAARSDFARGHQNIRNSYPGDTIELLRWTSESGIQQTDVIAPIFAWISKEAWVDFPPINWYSDDVQCHDIKAKGYTHFIGDFYVHHVGAQTCGLDVDRLNAEAMAWLEANRPELIQR